MNRAVAILCLAAAAGVWAWAFLWPKEATIEPLPARFVGEYQVAAIATPPGMVNPLPPGKQYVFRFAADGTYSFSVFLNGGYEIVRKEGVAAVSESGMLTLKQISENRRAYEAPAGTPPERYHAEWGKDETGPFLALRHADLGYTLRLR